jgi:hypothetical protein
VGFEPLGPVPARKLLKFKKRRIQMIDDVFVVLLTEFSRFFSNFTSWFR